MFGTRRGWSVATLTFEEATPKEESSSGLLRIEGVATRLGALGDIIAGPNVILYWHHPEHGKPYVVVEIDDADTADTPAAEVKVYRNEALIWNSQACGGCLAPVFEQEPGVWVDPQGRDVADDGHRHDPGYDGAPATQAEVTTPAEVYGEPPWPTDDDMLGGAKR